MRRDIGVMVGCSLLALTACADVQPDVSEAAQALVVTMTLSDGTTPLNEYRGVIAGPAPATPGACPYAVDDTASILSGNNTLANSLYDVGIRQIRNNDYADDTMDLSQMFTCAQSPYGSNLACNNEYPCWSGCGSASYSSTDATKILAYPTDCAAYVKGVYGRSGYISSDGRYDTMSNSRFEAMVRLGDETGVDSSLLASGVTARSGKGPQSIYEEASWIAAAKCVANRFNARRPFTYLDILTETTGHFWSRPYNELVPFWVTAFNSIKAEFGSTFKVGGPGLWGPEWNFPVRDEHLAGSGCSATATNHTRRLFNALYAAGTAPDFIDMHVFSDDIGDYKNFVDSMRAYMHRTGACFAVGGPQSADLHWDASFFSNTELVVGAFFGSTDPFRKGQQGAVLGASSLMTFQNAGVTRAYTYRADNSDGAIMACDANATPTPRANVYRFWNTLMTAGATQGTINLGVTNPDLYVMAASDSGAPDYDRYVLLANKSGSTLTFAPTWSSGKGNLAQHTVKQKAVINSTSNGTSFSNIPATATVVDIAAYETMLIRLKQ